jgi:hypothetical protein
MISHDYNIPSLCSIIAWKDAKIMSDMVLKENLRETLMQSAARENRSVDDLVNEAVETYLLEQQRSKLDQEILAFERLYGQLMENYYGEWVAIHDGQLVDHDIDGTALYKRIRSRFGTISVLLRRVTEDANEDIWLRTPTTGQIPT